MDEQKYDDFLTKNILKHFNFFKFVNHNDYDYNYKFTFTILYNYIPAYILAPILLYKGIKYKDIFIIIIGILLFIVDTIHFFNAFNNMYEEN
jgi:hypothetical protein